MQTKGYSPDFMFLLWQWTWILDLYFLLLALATNYILQREIPYYYNISIMLIWLNLFHGSGSTALSEEVLLYWVLWQAWNKRLVSSTQLSSFDVATQFLFYMDIGYISTHLKAIIKNACVRTNLSQLSLQNTTPTWCTIFVYGVCKNQKGIVGGYIINNRRIILSWSL